MNSTFHSYLFPVLLIAGATAIGAEHFFTADPPEVSRRAEAAAYTPPSLSSGFADWGTCNWTENMPPSLQAPGYGLASLCGGVVGCANPCGGGGAYNKNVYLGGNAMAWAPPHDVISSAGQIPQIGTEHENVLVETGEVVYTEVDFVLPGEGFDLVWTRTYRSGSEYDGDMGYGWDFSANQRLVEDSSGDEVAAFLGYGRAEEAYTKSGADYTSPAGFHDELTKGTRPSTYSDTNYANLAFFTKTEKDGVVREFDLIDSTNKVYGCTVIKDLLGNEITLEYASLDSNPYLQKVTGTRGKVATLTYSGTGGRLSKVEVASTVIGDYTNLTIDYEYDTGGTLATATRHQQRNELTGSKVRPYSEYTYFTSGIENKNLEEVYVCQDPDLTASVAQLTFEYAPTVSTKEWCTKVTDGDGNVHTYAYDQDDGTYDYTKYVDPLGSQRDFIYADLSGGDRTIERIRENLVDNSGTGYTSATVITRDCDCGRVSKVAYDDTSEERWEYDTLGNVDRYVRISANDADLWLAKEWKYKSFANYSRLEWSSGALQEVAVDSAPSLTAKIAWEWETDGMLKDVTLPAVTTGQSSSQTIKWQYTFDSSGRLATRTTPGGVRTAWSYSGSTMTEKVGASGSEMTVKTEKRNLFGTLEEATGKYGTSSKWTWTVSPNRPLKMVGPDGQEEQFKYSLDGKMTEQKTLLSSSTWETTTMDYTDGGMLDLTTADSASGGIQAETDYTYAPSSDYEEVIGPDGLGSRVEFGFGSHNLPYKRYNVDTGAGTREVLIETIERDKMGRKTASTGMDGIKTTYEYDGYGRLECTEFPLPGNKMRVTTLSRKPWGAVEKTKVTVQGTCYSETQQYFDEAWRTWKSVVRNPDTAATRDTVYERNADGMPTTVTNAAGGDTTTTYDSYGRVEKMVSPDGSEVLTSYDMTNRKVTRTIKEKKTDGGGFVNYGTVTKFDLSERMTEGDDQGSSSGSRKATYTYDKADRNLSVTAPEGGKTTLTYDKLGRVVEEDRQIDGATTVAKTEYVYSEGGALKSVEDADGNLTESEYDRFGNLVKTTLNKGATTHEYENVYSSSTGRLSEQKLPNGVEHEFYYDTAGRVDYMDINKGTTGLGGPDRIRYTYSTGSQLVTAKTQEESSGSYSDISTTTRIYDGWGSIKEETQAYGGISGTFKYEYDDFGLVDKITYPDQTNGLVLEAHYVRDTSGRMDEVKRKLGSSVDGAAAGVEVTAAFEYQGGRETKRTQANFGIHRDTTYTNFGEIDTLKYLKTSTSVLRAGFKYHWDDDSRLLVKDRLHDAIGANAYGEVYRYDDAGRLTKMWRNVKNPVNFTSSDPIKGTDPYLDEYDYNLGKVYERESVVVEPYVGSAATTTYTTNAFHQIESVGSTNLTWDGNGQNTANGSDSYTWNALGQLASGSSGGTTWDFEYDALGRRIYQTDGTAESKLIYHGPQMVGEYDCVNNDWIWQQLPTGIGEGILEHISLDSNDLDGDSSTTDYRQYLTAMDYQQSFCCIADVNGSGVEIYDYLGPYGESDTRNGSGTSIGNYVSQVHNWKRVHGGTVVEDLGIYDFRNRWLNPATGGWLSRDPLGLADSPNLYQGMLGAPTVFSDPMGLQSGDGSDGGGTETVVHPRKGDDESGPTVAEPVWKPDWGLSVEWEDCQLFVLCRPAGPTGVIAATSYGARIQTAHALIVCCEMRWRITYWCGSLDGAGEWVYWNCHTYSLLAKKYEPRPRSNMDPWSHPRIRRAKDRPRTGSFTQKDQEAEFLARWKGGLEPGTLKFDIGGCENVCDYLDAHWSEGKNIGDYPLLGNGRNSNTWVIDAIRAGGGWFSPFSVPLFFKVGAEAERRWPMPKREED